ncbi:SirR/DtxR family transcription regulator SirR [Natronomonas pharaonis DSM 2160]|uniref:SirR/DtxR family transcription regulator SirR n=1 Tax=Natronomonas pharaonis (strain ATCC 35678 / DSM 2160 / CIP 103997 / JCM 8858 / NBRC 14720 / NCIMB 2260 / Gabara) TaxID=348780 RepID=A0A1U7EYY7_NATPD|nr:metal-dependent transcriptional regulator [Natronomonas pharaonis]CAI50454.1 SirR/DtxR family transcription regulator SirR [Natronomonas pharaonis DSM 2160]
MDASPVVEEYVKQLHRLEAEHGRRIRTTELAEAVDRTKASTTSMVQKLDERGLVEHEEYGGTALTPTGEAVADRLVRKHRLLETFLVEQLDLPEAVAHDEADRLEHHVSDGVTDRLAELLGAPGGPAWDSRAVYPAAASAKRLTSGEPGESLVVEAVPHRQPKARSYLLERGVKPGAVIEVDEVGPAGLVTVTDAAGDRSVPVPGRLARYVGVRPPPGVDRND